MGARGRPSRMSLYSTTRRKTAFRCYRNRGLLLDTLSNDGAVTPLMLCGQEPKKSLVTLDRGTAIVTEVMLPCEGGRGEKREETRRGRPMFPADY